MSKVKILYSTCGGNTKLVCEKVAEILEGASVASASAGAATPKAGTPHDVELFDVKVADEPGKIGDADVYVFASPTYGQGELEMYFERFLGKAADFDLAGKKCVVIALGDVKYHRDYLFEAATILTNFLKGKKAELIYRPLKVAMTPIPRLENVIKNWAEEFAKVI